MCLEPSVTGFYRVSQKVSDVIPVLRLTPIGTQPSAVSLASPSAVHCGRICRAQTCAHSGIEPSTLDRGFYRMGQKFDKNSNFWPFLASSSPIRKAPLTEVKTAWEHKNIRSVERRYLIHYRNLWKTPSSHNISQKSIFRWDRPNGDLTICNYGSRPKS